MATVNFHFIKKMGEVLSSLPLKLIEKHTMATEKNQYLKIFL